jgi:hypothetical protein
MFEGTWSHAAMVALSVIIIAMSACCFRPKRRNRRVRPARPHIVADYSAKRERALEQLGDDYLLARPINRRNA